MSTVITFGYIGGPSGSPNAIPVQLLLLPAGQLTPGSGDPTGMPYCDTNGKFSAVLTADAAVVPSVPFPQLSFPPTMAELRNVTLACRYWPVGVQGFAREGQTAGGAGTSIRVSQAEIYALNCAGALSTY